LPTTANDLFELRHAADVPHDGDVLASRDINPGSEHLAGGGDYWRDGLQVFEASQMALADITLIGDDPENVIRVLLHQIRVALAQRRPHVFGVFLVYAKNDGLGVRIVLQQRPDMFGDGVSPLPLAGGIVLQMNQAAPADQGILRHQRKRCEDPNLDRRVRLRARRHRQEAIGAGDESLPDSTDFERDAFRENAHFTGSPAIRFPRESRRSRQPVESVRLIAGQQ
jgi:hypothetical protein